MTCGPVFLSKGDAREESSVPNVSSGLCALASDLVQYLSFEARPRTLRAAFGIAEINEQPRGQEAPVASSGGGGPGPG